MRKSTLMAMLAATAIAFASGCASSAYLRTVEEARRKMEEQKKSPLPPLPPYPETSVQYATSARILVVGGDVECKLLTNALKAAGYAVTDTRDIQSAAFNRTDFILYPSLEPGTEYGEGSVWTRVRLVVSVRRPVTLGKDGCPLPSAPPRAFQAFARVANPGGVRVFTSEERLAEIKRTAFWKQHSNQENYARIKSHMEESFKASDEQVAPAADAAVANLLRIAPFRELLAKP